MSANDKPLTICDLTQSFSLTGGGGITTYLGEKAKYVLANTPHTLIQIVPGERDQVIENGRHIRVHVGAAGQPNTPAYRFIFRTGAVRDVLERFRPDIIESQCPWLLPWTAIRYGSAHPESALVAGYRTDFPTAQIHRVFNKTLGPQVAEVARNAAKKHARRTYKRFDRVYVLGEAGRGALREYGIDDVSVLDLGVHAEIFSPDKRDPEWRRDMGHEGDGPLLVYVGRFDPEKRPGTLIEALRRLPRELGARLVMIGNGRGEDDLRAQAKGLPVTFAGFFSNRHELARGLASSDIYVSGMADETFGISIIEAQAAGLPVVGVASGAMPERVEPGTGLLGPVEDADAMAANILAVWNGNHDAMGAAARALIERRYSWDKTFANLFGNIYPAALAARDARIASGVKRPVLPRVRDRYGAFDFG